MPADDRRSPKAPGTAVARRASAAAAPWRGDEHRLQIDAAVEAGLRRDDVELDLYTQGFSAGMTVDDPLDGSIVARGRTVLRENELRRSLRPALTYLGVPLEAVKLRIHDGSFELRVSQHAAEQSRPVLDAGKAALKLWIGFGLLGLACYSLAIPALAGLVWGVGLLLGGWQLRRGMASGRAMLAARLAIGLAMLAQEEKIILPPLDAPTEDLA